MQTKLLQLLVVQKIATIFCSATHSATSKDKVCAKVHHYQLTDMGVEFVLEPDPGNYGYRVMTSQRSRVKCGDRIVFHESSGQRDYRVVDIEYYSDPPDIWIAKLWPCL